MALETAVVPAVPDVLEQATEQIVRYFVQIDDPMRKSHARSVEAILGRYIRPTPVVVAVVDEDGVAITPTTKSVTAMPLGKIVVVKEEEPDFGVKRVPHVRGDVRAMSMGKRTLTVPGNRYIVSYRALLDGQGLEAISFEAMLIAKTLNAAGEEVLEFDNGVRIIDDLERFRFQRS